MHKKRQAGSAKRRGQRSLWWPCIPVIPKGTRSQLKTLLGMYLSSWCFAVVRQQNSFPSFSIPSHKTSHNRLGIHMKQMSSDCHPQLFCFCVISVFLSPPALWPRTKAYSSIWPLPLPHQLDRLSWWLDSGTKSQTENCVSTIEQCLLLKIIKTLLWKLLSLSSWELLPRTFASLCPAWLSLSLLRLACPG